MSGIDDWLSEPEVLEPPKPGSTDWMDGIRTIEELADKNKLMAFCEHCAAWWGFERGVDGEDCPTCGGKYSTRIGFQLISLRTFRPEVHGVKKLPKKK